MFDKLPLPPFGRIISAYNQENIKLDFPLYIFVGKNSKHEAYLNKKNGTICCYLPYGENFFSYKWPVKNQKIIIYDTGSSVVLSLKKFAHHLLTVYEPSVIFLYSNSIPNEIFLPEGKKYNG